MDDWLKTGNTGNTTYINVEHKHVSIRCAWQVIGFHSISVKQQETSTGTTSGPERCDSPGSVVHCGDRTKDGRSASPGTLAEYQPLRIPAEPSLHLTKFEKHQFEP